MISVFATEDGVPFAYFKVMALGLVIAVGLIGTTSMHF